MNYKIQVIKDNKKWEEFLSSCEPNIFVQSFHYGEFYQQLGEQYFIVAVLEGEKIVGGSLVLTTNARRGKFLYLPYGPIIDYTNASLFKDFIEALKGLAKELSADFVRISPFIDDNEQSRMLFKSAGLRPAPMHVLAENTWILPLADSCENLFKSMRQTTRNLIKRGEREGVDVKVTQDEAAIDRLIKILQETAKRHNFVPFSEKYIKAEFNAFKEIDAVQVFEAYFEGEMVSSAIIFFYGDTAIYRHSGSSSKRIKCQPSYFLQWKVIKEAQKRGMKYYNFWGIAPEGSSKKHPFAGITTFKTGFGGFQKDLLHCHDLPISKKYWFNWLVETIRRLKRGF